MKNIINQLKKQRETAKEDFIKNCFISRDCKPDSPCPDTNHYLNIIGEYNEAIRTLENSNNCKQLNK